MISILNNNNKYILADYIITNAPIFSKGVRSSRDLIKKKNIDKDLYLFSRLKNDNWIITEGKSPKFDKVFIKESYLSTITELNKKDDKITTDDKGVEKAPDIINLSNEEKFQDDEGNILEIETRGVRDHNKIYFKVKDVSKGFEMESLYTTIIDDRNAYEKDKHYKFFTCDIFVYNKNITSKKIDKVSVKNELFLTYEGLLKVLFVSKNNKTSKFITWATKTLFTVQIGSFEQKQILGSNLIGADVESVKEVFSCNADKTPGIYLFLIGNANEITKDKKYGKDDIICKYGKSDNILRRTNEHCKAFKQQYNSDIELICYSIIDPKFISQAETNISHYFDNYKISIKDEKEFIVINKKDIKNIKEQYKLIQNSYIGHYQDLYNKTVELEMKLAYATHQLELLDEKHKNEIKDKEIELLQYKIKIMELQNKLK